jgi:UDP-N-acetylglucosamine 2-epimerase (non-hydrolysing)
MKRRRGEFLPIILHTGQHYDAAMSDVFFGDLELPTPDFYLDVGSRSHAAQTAAIMERFEPVVLSEKPDWVVVVGDVNSTVACALVCAKLGIRVAHVEAGLRSGDRSMPEEINRLLTDQIADLLLTPSKDADENLLKEGISQERIRFVGNVMIDSLMKHLPRAKTLQSAEHLGFKEREYAVLTLHRPSNVDEQTTLAKVLEALSDISQHIPIIFPVHPRTRGMISQLGLNSRLAAIKGLRIIEPLGYLSFLSLIANARIVLTDSGGLQEETTVLNIPCLTLRDNTERPITVTMGTNQIVGSDPRRIIEAFTVALSLASCKKDLPPLWDGQAAERIVDTLSQVPGA